MMCSSVELPMPTNQYEELRASVRNPWYAPVPVAQKWKHHVVSGASSYGSKIDAQQYQACWERINAILAFCYSWDISPLGSVSAVGVDLLSFQVYLETPFPQTDEMFGPFHTTALLQGEEQSSVGWIFFESIPFFKMYLVFCAWCINCWR